MGKSSIVTLSLVLLCLSLGWLAYEELKRPLPTSSRASSVAVRVAGDADAIPSKSAASVLPPIEMFDEITARPLFNISRRPVVVDKPAPVARQTELNLMLSGIVIGRTQQIAHLRSAADNRVQALSVGDRIENWRIEEIRPDSVVLRSGDRVETVFLQKPGSGSTATVRSGPRSKPGADADRRRTRDRSGQRIRDRTRRFNRQKE